MGIPQIEEYLDSLGRPAQEYHLNQRDTMVVAARLNPQFMARVVDRWMELEQKQQTQHPANALMVKMWAQVDTLHAQITQRDAQITQLLADQQQTLLAQSQQINALQGQLLGAKDKQIRLMDNVQRLKAMREKRDAHDTAIRMARQGASHADIAMATGRTLNHVRQILFQARAAGTLPVLPATAAMPSAQAPLFTPEAA
jgi:hypothetical protein